MIDRIAFNKARARALSENGEGYPGIGCLSEKTMHRTLKLYYEPDDRYHEVECFGSVADIRNTDGIIEIQRASFAYLLPKLERFLPNIPVTVVHPITVKKRVKRLDPETGEITATGRTVKGKTVFDSALEIFKIREYIGRGGFTLILVLLDCDEYRIPDPRARRGRGGERRLESIPVDIVDEYVLSVPADYLALLPESLGDRFTEVDFRKAVKSRSRYAYYYLRLLCELGMLSREREGRKYIYRKEMK